MSTPSDIARYRFREGSLCMEDDNGAWVHWQDHLAARAADAKRIEQLEVLLAESGMGRKAVQIALQLWRERDEAKEQVRQLATAAAEIERLKAEIAALENQLDFYEVD